MASLPPDDPRRGEGDPNEDTRIELAAEGHATPPPDADVSASARRGPIEDVAMYDVIEPPKPAGQASSSPTASAAHDAGKAKIDAPGLIDDFDEDADFSEESVLREARLQEAASAATLDDTVTEEGWDVFRLSKDAPLFVQAKGRVTLAGVKTPAIVGGVLLAIAVALAFARVQHGAVYAALSVLYLGLMHSVTGVGAVVIGTLEARARFGSFAVAWARMLVAVALLLVTVGLPVEGSARLVLAPIGAGVYALALYLLFKWKWRSVGIVCAAHFGLAMLLYVGEWLHGAVMSAGRAG